MRRDVLAAGASKASFAGGYGETDYSRNLAKDGFEEVAIDKTVTTAPRKKFLPLGKTILVRRAEAKSPQGIFLPDSVQQDKPAEGQVLAVGREVTTLNVGEDIAFGRYAGAEFPLNGETLLIMNVDEVLGIIGVEEPSEVKGVFAGYEDCCAIQHSHTKLQPQTVVGQA